MTMRRRWWLFAPLLPVLAVVAVLVWAAIPMPAMPEALQATRSSSQVEVEEGRWLTFRATSGLSDVGLILYPGARVDYRAYAPLARAIAAQGYVVALVPMPLNLAILGAERASRVLAANPQVRGWAIGGHSLGGAMAARYCYRHPLAARAMAAPILGLALWAAYPAASEGLAERPLRVVSIHATQDGLATRDKIIASRGLLPVNTYWVEISGGNHAQFGWYGSQPGDDEPAISRQEQQDQVVAATLVLLEEISMYLQSR